MGSGPFHSRRLSVLPCFCVTKKTPPRIDGKGSSSSEFRIDSSPAPLALHIGWIGSDSLRARAIQISILDNFFFSAFRKEMMYSSKLVCV